MFYIEKDNKIVLFDENKEKLIRTLAFMPDYQGLEILETNRPIKDFQFADTEEFQQEQTQKERRRLDALKLTPSDVERALYKAKKMDFDDLKALISEKIPNIDLKGLAIEFRAKDFWRGATLEDGTRIFDVVGALLGFTPEDMDYLFENKELPVKVVEPEPEEITEETVIEESEE